MVTQHLINGQPNSEVVGHLASHLKKALGIYRCEKMNEGILMQVTIRWCIRMSSFELYHCIRACGGMGTSNPCTWPTEYAGPLRM